MTPSQNEIRRFSWGIYIHKKRRHSAGFWPTMAKKRCGRLITAVTRPKQLAEEIIPATSP